MGADVKLQAPGDRHFGGPRRRRRGAERASALLLALAIAAGAAAAQQPGEPGAPAPREGDTVGWHVVRPGETLQAITEHYLGTPLIWRDNWRLNPQLRDPNLLYPGQRLRVITDRRLPGRAAEVAEVSRKVEEKPQPNDWMPARAGDLLRADDGVRTFKRSSAELAFDDGSRLQVTEDSLIFLKRLDSSLAGVPQQTIEVVAGQADLAARAGAGSPSDIEIVLGGATARPRPDASGLAASRARRVGGEESGGGEAAGGAQVMVYSGASAVEAAGQKVEVARGMGTSVPEGGPPAPPERLLAAPRSGAPAAGSRWPYSNPRFTWAPVASAAAYVLEICFDPGCARLAERVTGIAEAAWQPATLPAGDLHWRVTAVAASGLDGYPAATVPFAIDSDAPDREAPVVAVALQGAGVVRAEGAVVVGRGGALLPAAHDDASGVAAVSYRWDGGPWQRWDGGALSPPAGEHLLELQAVDALGRESVIWQVAVAADLTPPEPPEVTAAP